MVGRGMVIVGKGGGGREGEGGGGRRPTGYHSTQLPQTKIEQQ